MYKDNQGFTLVELIVVVTLLAILGTIGFISFLGYSKYSRDLVRISDINNIKRSLGLYIVQTGKYPLPSNSSVVTYSGANVWTQGTFGDSTFSNVRVINKIPLDPVASSEYTYSITNDKLEYEISGILEGDNFLSLNFANQVIAKGTRYAKAYIEGTYNGIVTKIKKSATDYVLAIPSITSNNLDSTDLESIMSEKRFVYKGFLNLPNSYKNSIFNVEGGFNFNLNGSPIVFKGDLKDLQELNNQIILLDSIQNAYSGTIIKDKKGIVNTILNSEIDLVKPSEQIKVLACSFINYTLKYYVECSGLDFITFFVTNILHFDISNLPGSQINIAFQDITNGDFWFGTNDGVAKYSDGVWTIYQRDPNDPNSLVHNNVTSITKDNLGYYWFGTVNGISKFDGNNTWVTYSSNVLVSSHIQYIYTASDGTVWIGTNGGINTYNSSVWEDYIGKSDGLSANNITTIFEDSNLDIWFGTNSKGVDKYLVGTGTIVNYSTPDLPSKVVTYIFEDTNNNIWVGTDGGLAHQTVSSGIWEEYTTSNTSLPDNKITYIYEDSNNNFWFGTINYGVVRVTNDLLTWTTYDTNSTPLPLSGNEIKSIYQDDTGNVLIISDGGINTIDSSGNLID